VQKPKQPGLNPSAAADRPSFLTQTQICERFGISDETWRRWRKARQVPAPLPNIPGHPRWAVADIEDFERGRFGATGRHYFVAARRR
jgi:hypothetical protein